MQEIKNKKLYKNLYSSYNEILNNYENQYKSLKGYFFYINNTKENFYNILLDFEQNAKVFKNNINELDIYEKLASIIIAIKYNPCIIIKNKIGIINYTFLNSSFAIDVALKTYEKELEEICNIEEIFENEHLSYTKELLIDIIESKNIEAQDILGSLKLEIDLIRNYNGLTKIKSKKLSI